MSDNLNHIRIQFIAKLDTVERVLIKARGAEGFTIGVEEINKVDELMQELIDLIVAVPRNSAVDKQLGYVNLCCLADLPVNNFPAQPDIRDVITDARVMKMFGHNTIDSISEFAFLNIRLGIFAEGIDPGVQLSVEILRRELAKTLRNLAIS